MQLQRNALGKLVLTSDDGIQDIVVAVRSFPIQAPEAGISLIGSDGHEKAWIAHLNDLPAAQAQLVSEELQGREFMPTIQRLLEVSSFATPSTWTVDTDRGRTQFVLKGEEDIRRLSRSVLLVSDSHGVQFLIREPQSLDKHSRKLLDRFL
jgi:Domain of unknown function (DUF1854)